MKKLDDILKDDPVDVRDAVKAAGWLGRNIPRLARWVKYLVGRKVAVLLVCALALASTAGSCVKYVANLPEIPEPPQRTPASSVTPTPTPEAK